MTVQDWFEGDKITKQDVLDIAEESEYQASASNFITQNWERDVDDLSFKQSSWASRILEDMVERRITKSRRPRF